MLETLGKINAPDLNPKIMLSPFALKAPFVSGIQPGTAATDTWWFVFANNRLLLHVPKNEGVTLCKLDPEKIGLRPNFTKYLGRYASADCFVATLEEEPPLSSDMKFCDLRSLFGVLDDDLFRLAGRAIQIVHWHREHRFCGKCGSPMVDQHDEIARKCPVCNFINYPRLSPAVIMSVVRGDHILLARSPHFPPGMYSALAGFVEPGETLEEAVCREIFEEVAVKVDNIQYVASQPWPFPHSLMIGFTSTYAGGEIRVNLEELEDARWFPASKLPLLPSAISISRLLINNFINRSGT
jgi:NAD+ diphosphatase